MTMASKSIYFNRCYLKYYVHWLLLLLVIILCYSAAEEEKEEENKEVKESKVEEAAKETRAERPHIIFILADDLGWNDVGFSGNSRIPTPNIDALASSSLILGNYYTEPTCTPSRASFLTGKYPIHIGFQNRGIRSGEPAALPLDIKTLPEYLKSLDYLSHIVGKWHLGYFRKEYTPTYRGFDSFFGFYNEQIDYFDYTNYEKSADPKVTAFYGVDLQSDDKPIKSFRGKYATEVFTDKAVEIIENHNASMPLFLFLSHLACHTGNEYMTLQAPVSSINKVGNFSDVNRRIYAAMVNSLDDSVGRVVDSLNRRNFLQNTILVFVSDGGSASQSPSSSWPLRGRQPAVWEGAIRVPGLIWSPLLGIKEQKIANQLMHVSDWLPTLYSAIGGNTAKLGALDGLNMWKALGTDSQSPRFEILHNINLDYGLAALRRGDYKLIRGKAPGDNDLWYGFSEIEDYESNTISDDDKSLVQIALESLDMALSNSSNIWKKNALIQCEQPSTEDVTDCNPEEYPCLFNVAADPCEYRNLARKYPRIVRSMMKMLNMYNETMVDPLANATDPRADPRCHGFAFVPWLDEEYASDCVSFLSGNQDSTTDL